MYRELCGSEGVMLQQNKILQQVFQQVHQVHHDSNLNGVIDEQQEKNGQIVAEVNRSREELAKLKMPLRQGFILIDETCAKHSSALEGLQSWQEQKLGQDPATIVKSNGDPHRTLELERNTTLDWRMQTIEMI